MNILNDVVLVHLVCSVFTEDESRGCTEMCFPWWVCPKRSEIEKKWERGRKRERSLRRWQRLLLPRPTSSPVGCCLPIGRCLHWPSGPAALPRERRARRAARWHIRTVIQCQCWLLNSGISLLHAAPFHSTGLLPPGCRSPFIHSRLWKMSFSPAVWEYATSRVCVRERKKHLHPAWVNRKVKLYFHRALEFPDKEKE